jgi:predicted anti-sigma-YlaC factor YlaD
LNQKNFANWVEKIYATEENELDCNQTQTYLPAYVEAEVNGRPQPSHSHMLQAHLAQCPDCRETYVGLQHVLEAEATGELEEISQEDRELIAGSPTSEPMGVA